VGSITVEHCCAAGLCEDKAAWLLRWSTDPKTLTEPFDYDLEWGKVSLHTRLDILSKIVPDEDVWKVYLGINRIVQRALLSKPVYPMDGYWEMLAGISTHSWPVSDYRVGTRRSLIVKAYADYGYKFERFLECPDSIPLLYGRSWILQAASWFLLARGSNKRELIKASSYAAVFAATSTGICAGIEAQDQVRGYVHANLYDR